MDLGTIVRVAIAVAAFLLIMRVGIVMLRGLARPAPAPPPPGELRKVKIGYRCEVCGSELRMTVAPDDDPPPPRHCLEDMTLIAPVE